MNAGEPFRFCTELRLVASTGIQVRNLESLSAALHEVPGAPIVHDTHHHFQEHHFRKPVVYNDFAIWAGEAQQERELAERLAGLDLRRFTTMRELREPIIAQLEWIPRCNHRWQQNAPRGKELYFCRWRSFVISTGIVAADVPDFFRRIRTMSVNSISMPDVTRSRMS